jgi:D-tagatose-1,6-bisphosphate aldolase subunit GatZ/KbaZ
VCSAHPWVIEAAMIQAQEDGTHLLLEATCNQVNQAGGYTGLTPAMFRDFAFGIANQVGFDQKRMILGGDHLGPNPWKNQDAKTAMQQAVEMVRLYVEAGFTKIHLDASMRCADDPAILADDVMAARAVELCTAAEMARREPGSEPILYIIGTEVPTPGGANHTLDVLQVTSTEAAEQTVEVHRAAFLRAGLDAAWERVIGIVVQPGVEFDHDSVVNYNPGKASHLQRFLRNHSELVMEAHSSDYQLAGAYQDLIRDGFSILKVGPALTFALREALYALAALEGELLPGDARSNMMETMETVMLAHPADWQNYYHGSAEQQKLLRIYSYSDRIRYYWRYPEAEAAVARLIQNLQKTGIPETLLSQYCPCQYDQIREGKLRNDPKAIVISNIRQVLAVYSRACLGSKEVSHRCNAQQN